MVSGVAMAVEVGFWPTKVHPPKNVRVENHPCGSEVIINTNVIPKRVPWLEADTVQEVDSDGQVLHTWQVPIDYYAVGLEGTTVLLAFGSGPTSVLKVTLDGHLSVGEKVPHPLPRPVACPARVDTNYACVVVRDSPRRLLAYPIVCS
jgi:hypothetical protein